jgi:hypothetical protein
MAVRCPVCGGVGLRIVYGLFVEPPPGDVVPGGCTMTGDDPTHECAACEHRWDENQRADA